jgi:hypothetical protein
MLTPRFTARRKACGATSGTLAGQALGATITSLCEAEQLPGLLDVVAMMPPTAKALVRQVPGFALWVWYDLPDPGHVRLLTVTRAPPAAVT